MERLATALAVSLEWNDAGLVRQSVVEEIRIRCRHPSKQARGHNTHTQRFAMARGRRRALAIFADRGLTEYD
jgi:hypothetical protein